MACPLLAQSGQAVGRFGGTRLSELGYDFGVLLGRDFLLSAQMVYDGRTGSVVVSDDTPMYPPTVAPRLDTGGSPRPLTHLDEKS